MPTKEVKLKVMEALQEEAYKGIVRIDMQTMRELDIRPGDIVEIEGGRKTVSIADRAYPSDIGQNIIRMDGIIRRNAKTGIGEYTIVRKTEVKEAKSITIAPAQQGVMIQADPTIFKRGLFGRPVVKGDIVSLGGAKRRQKTFTGSPFEEIFNVFEEGYMGAFGLSGLKFIIADANPKQAVIITENSNIKVSPKAVEVSDERVPDVTYEDIGGLDEELTKIREMVELPLKHPEIFERLGIEAPKGVLLHGPPGTGKTLLAKAVANECEANFILVNGPELTSRYYGDSEKRIRDIFEEAEKNAPTIIFFDEIDSVAPKREETYGEVERRMVAQLLATMDGMKSRGKVIVIGATNRPNALDPALRRPGRFDREVQIGVPNKEGRLKILKIHSRNMPLSKDVKLDEVASITHGFVGADLQALCKEAAMIVLRKALPDLKLKDEKLSDEFLIKLVVTKKDFQEALKVVRPSALREVLIENPNIHWEDIGGLNEIKQELAEAVEWPLKNPQVFERLGIRPTRGILLYGPPGTGKTLIAKSVATESEANFISVKGPELISMWVGESLPYNEELIVKENGIVKRMKIGDIVEKRLDVEILAFDKDKRIRFTKIDDFIKHKLTGNLLEVTTRTGRKIKVTDYHSLFSFVNGKLTDIPVSHLIPGESYIAIPRNLNLPRENIKNINLYDHLKSDKDIFVSGIKDYLIRAKKILDSDRTAEILNISKKYLADVISKDLPISIAEFDVLIKEAKLSLNFNEIRIKLKGSIHQYPTILNIDKDLWRLVGVWIAEGDLNGYTVRIHNQNKEIREDIKKICEKYEFSFSEMETCITINSRLLQKIFKKVLGLETGSGSKRLPTLAFILDKESKANLLKGYFSGDGSIYEVERGKFHIEAGTVSEQLANDLMYLLLDFGIVATRYRKSERTGSTTNRISILGVKNFERFKDVGFIDKERNDRIMKYMESRAWSRSDLIPLSGELYELVSNQSKVYATNESVGKEYLKNILVYVDKDRTKYKEYWDLVEGDIYFDLVKEIKIIEPEEYVYDISVPGEQNFVAGFGGIIAHNSEKGVRKIFEKARQAAPCIIFFDEIDAIASKRGLDAGSKATERVVNQILTEMDGLQDLHDVVVIAATNRVDMLDTALLRPGRFDKIISTPIPDKDARLTIFKIHTKNMPLTKDVHLEKLAELTKNCVGADIEALCREAGLTALREDINAKQVTMKHFEKALQKIKPSIREEELKRYREVEEAYIRSAKHGTTQPPSYLG